MKKLLALLIGLLVTGLSYGTDVSGIISTNTTWNLAGSPYIVTADITVNSGVTLTVDPNVIVKFNSARTLVVQGTLTANTATFTSNLATPAAGDWYGIYVTAVAGTANIMGCTVRYAVQMYNQNGNMNLTNTVLEFFKTYGIYNNGGTTTMTGGLINMTGYTTGYGIYPTTGSVTTLSNVNIINGNYGIVFESAGASVNLTNITITNNIWPIYYGVNSSLSVNGSCSFTGNTRNAVNVGLSSITTALTFPKVNVPYYFASSFTVQNEATLTIGSGNILKFPLNYGLIVNGTLNADANVGENIFFTSHRDDNWGGDSNNDGSSTAPATSDWIGVRFNSTSSSSLMDGCKLRYAGYYQVGGISMFNASPTITNCELQFNYYGAYLSGACNPNFSYNTIGSSSLTPIAMSIEAFPEFTDNVLSFMDNQYDAIGILTGTLTANANLIQRNFTNVSNITYVLLGSLTIPSGRTLTVQPGVVIKPVGAYQIIVQGKLVADGTPTQKIVLTSIHDDNYGNPGDTNRNGTLSAPANGNVGAVIFANGYDPASIMDNWIMKYATASYSYPNGTGSHSVYSSAVAVISALPPSPAGPTISNCEFSNLFYGIISYQAANPIITNNSMVNIAGTAFAVSAAANPTFSGNTFTNVGIIAMGLVGNSIYVNGTISKRNLSAYTNITYYLLEPLTIENNTYINVDPGVVIKMPYFYSIIVNGGFKTNGTATEPVIFTSYKDDNVGNPQDTNGDGNTTAPAVGDWLYIRYTDNSDDAFNVLNYAVFKYGGYGSNGSIFTTINASPTLNNSVITQASGGIRCEGNSAGFFNNVTLQNTWNPIGMSLTSNPTFTNITYTANSNNGIWIIDNTLSSNVTLTKRNVAGFTNIPYIIGSLTINSGATLTLVPGIIIKSQNGGFYVNGGLNATGTSGEKIYFTSFKDDAVGGDTNNDGSGSVPGYDWYGFTFLPSSIDDNNKLIYCDIRYISAGGYGISGAINATDASFEISNTVLRFVSGDAFGIYGTANPSITNCQLENIAGYPVYMDMFANPTFSGNISLSNVGYHAIYIKGQTISQSSTMPQRNFAGYNNITYVMGSMTINSGTTFTIPAGMVIKGGSFTVNGKLVVAGTSGNPVVFTDLEDDTYGNPADTRQNGNLTAPYSGGTTFTFNDVSDDASSINYAIMRYTTYGITLNSAAPNITNNTFNKMFIGILCTGVSTPVINNNSFHDLTDTPFSISLVSYPSSTTGNTISGTTYKAIRVKDETLTQDVTLPKRAFGGLSNIPYLVGVYTIGTGVTLTIQPGVIIKFGSNGYITVNNGLIAEGAATNEGNIVFTSISDDFHGGDSNSDGTATPYNGVAWGGIVVNDVANDALVRFENCIFRMASTYPYYGIRTINANPSFISCNFNNCYLGISANGTSNPLINNCDFYNINQEAVNNVNQTFIIKAENCWWGSNNGPTHSGNPGGTGEPVTNGVDYLPYGTNGVVNPLSGDVSLNGSVQAFDASLVLKHVATVITLNAKQQVVADVSGTAGITAYDASLILQFAVGMISTFPAELLSPLSPYTSNAELFIGEATAMPGEEFMLPLSLSNVDEVFAGQMTLSFDPEILQALEIISLIPEMTVVSNIDAETGTIHLTFAGVEALQSDLTFAEIRFKAKENLTGQETTVEGKSFMANESELNGNISNGTVIINSLATGVNGLAADNGKTLNCYPNPVRDQLTINYEVMNDGDNVQIAVYDLYGKMMAEVVNGRHAAESYSVTWNSQDGNGEKIPVGTYLIRLTTGSKTEVQKIQIVR
jgi:hypothetical protein